MAARVIDLGDLTLDEMDAVEAVKTEHGVGYTVAAATVFLRRETPGFSVDDARKLRSRDVSIVDTTGDPDHDGAGPTPARF
jgi:hypothetical protein